jgi:hypothetical protein
MNPSHDPHPPAANAPARPNPALPSLPEGVWAGALEAATQPERPWLWHGYLAPRSVTLWTSRSKAGKTTLLAVLLARRVTGSVLADRAVTPGKSVVVSEESQALWNGRRRLDFGHHTCFFCRPFRGKPSAAEWLALIDCLGEMRDRDGVDLAVIDPLAHFLPGRGENHAALMLEALTPLQRLTERDMAVLLLHHPSKARGAEGEAARGSGALPAFADIIVEMGYRASRAGGDRRRLLRGYSRYDQTPRELVIELNREGTDYAALGDAEQDELKDHWEQLRLVLAQARGKLTRREIIEQWADEGHPPPETNLRRWLEAALDRGVVRCEGAGTRQSPLRYWLPESEEKWQRDPIYQLLEAQRRALESLGPPPADEGARDAS